MYPSQTEFLQHILDECNYLVHEANTNTFTNFFNDKRLAKAICRSLEIIGEASTRIDSNIKAKYNEVAWREMSNIRNKIIHDYFGIDYDIVWDTVKSDIPILKECIETILSQK
jgi:uncharacterized protein with HEPN domain